jgi:hypothetical protein
MLREKEWVVEHRAESSCMLLTNHGGWILLGLENKPFIFGWITFLCSKIHVTKTNRIAHVLNRSAGFFL